MSLLLSRAPPKPLYVLISRLYDAWGRSKSRPARPLSPYLGIIIRLSLEINIDSTRPQIIDQIRSRHSFHWTLTQTVMATSENTAALLRFVGNLTADDIPEDVWLRIEDLFLDWLASAFAAQNSHPNPMFEKMANLMGPKDGTAQILANGTTSSPYWAAWVNAASSHTLEQDDLHNSSVMHPAT